MCDVIKIRIKRRIAKRSGNFEWSFYFILLLVASILFGRIFITAFMALSSASHKAMLKSLYDRTNINIRIVEILLKNIL